MRFVSDPVIMQAAAKRNALQREREALKKAKKTLQLLELKDEAATAAH